MATNRHASAKSIECRARFDRIRYANCWEDADVLLTALLVKEGGTYLSVASAGDNALALLSGKPKCVLAIDMNPAQLACVEIRKAAFQCLSYEEVLIFLGVRPGRSRRELYAMLAGNLSAAARAFWDQHPKLIAQGIIHVGKFERYLALFRAWILPLIHNRKKVARLLCLRDSAARQDFYHTRWNTLRWRMLFKFFFSRTLLGRLGRDPEFFRYVRTDVAGCILKRTQYALTALSTTDNPYLDYILTGTYGRTLPFYLRPEHFKGIRDNSERLIIKQATVRQALTPDSSIMFDGFNLSDIFEYMSQDQYEEEIETILARANPGARLVFWNMLADRGPTKRLETKMRFYESEAAALFRQDKAFFYKSLIVGEAK